VTDDRRWAGVLFDLDGTLADTVELILMSYRHTMRVHLGETLPDELWLATIGTPLPLQLGDFARSDEERLHMLETYRTFQRTVHDEMVRPFPGAGPVLDELRRRGLRLAVVTSKAAAIARRTMEVCGLWERVDFVVGGDEVTRGKPDPEPVARALDYLDLSGRAGEVIFVGDSPFDLRSGRAAGTRTAAVGWGPHAHEILHAESPDYFLRALEDLLVIVPARSGAVGQRGS
jgi:pyrophosphatase PpaX